MQLHDDDPLARTIGLDYVGRVWYKNETFNIPWTNVFNGIFKTPSRVWYGNGNKLSIFYGSDSNELVDKALVMYPISSQTRAYKNGFASDVMKEFIEENVGIHALVAEGRFIDGVNPLTVIAPNPGIGPVWEGNMGHDLLIKALQTVRDYSLEQDDRIEFMVYYSENYTWVAEIGKLFIDRTTNGLDQSTGLNAAGNYPIILSPLYGNVDQYTQSKQRVQENNVVLVLGQQVGEDREVILAIDTDSTGISPIAQREALAQTQNQGNLQEIAQSELEARVGKQHVLIEPKFTESFAIFRDLNIGDFFTTVSLDRASENKQLVELRVVVQQTEGGRTISQYTLFTETREP